MSSLYLEINQPTVLIHFKSTYYSQPATRNSQQGFAVSHTTSKLFEKVPKYSIYAEQLLNFVGSFEVMS